MWFAVDRDWDHSEEGVVWFAVVIWLGLRSERMIRDLDRCKAAETVTEWEEGEDLRKDEGRRTKEEALKL